MRKITITFLTASSAVVLLTVPPVRADVAAQMKEAEGFYQAGQYAQAEQTYLKVVTDANPTAAAEAEAVFRARRRLPAVYLAANQLSQAQAAVAQLLADYAEHPRLPHALHEVLDQAQPLKKTQQAGQIYQKLLAAQPHRSQALWLKMGIAIANVHLGDDKAVDVALGHIASEHAADERVAEAFGQVAWAYRKLEQLDKAMSIYQYVVDHWPAKERAIFSQRGLIWSHLALGDEAKARAATEKLLVDFAKHKDLAEVVYTTANEFRGAERYESAIGLYQYMVDRWPSHEQALLAQRNTILSYLALNDDANAQAAMEKLLAGFAGHKDLPEAVHATANAYRSAERHHQACALYRYVVDQWPGSARALPSQRFLILSYAALGDEEATQAAIDGLLARFPKDPQLLQQTTQLAENFCRMRMHDHACQLWRGIMQNWPQTDQAASALMWIAETEVAALIEADDQTAVQQAVETLIARYRANPHLSRTLAHIGDEYQGVKQYENAEAVYRRMIGLGADPRAIAP
ncbi:MAG: tetratricopeptide repeat protein [Planctomycetes bacterium]|nr:tetratricopeptide repeat protein [Planctomycetota bacterium]